MLLIAASSQNCKKKIYRHSMLRIESILPLNGRRLIHESGEHGSIEFCLLASVLRLAARIAAANPAKSRNRTRACGSTPGAHPCPAAPGADSSPQAFLGPRRARAGSARTLETRRAAFSLAAQAQRSEKPPTRERETLKPLRAQLQAIYTRAEQKVQDGPPRRREDPGAAPGARPAGPRRRGRGRAARQALRHPRALRVGGLRLRPPRAARRPRSRASSTLWRRRSPRTPRIWGFVKNPTIPRAEKVAAVEKLFEGSKASSITVNTLTTLAANARLGEVDKVIEAYATLMKAERKEVDAVITSATELTAAQTKKISAALKPHLKQGETVKLSAKVDPSLLGGLTVQIGTSTSTCPPRRRSAPSRARTTGPGQRAGHLGSASLLFGVSFHDGTQAGAVWS